MISLNKDMNRFEIIKRMSLISNEMMMREFEILLWACLNSQEYLSDIISKPNPQSSLLTRLMMTAFYIKEKFSP